MQTDCEGSCGGDEDCYEHDASGGAMVIDGDHVLLVDHKNSGLWLPPGGHIDEDELHGVVHTDRVPENEVGVLQRTVVARPVG